MAVFGRENRKWPHCGKKYIENAVVNLLNENTKFNFKNDISKQAKTCYNYTGF